MGFFGDLWKGAKKSFAHIKQGVGAIIGDKAPAIAGAIGSMIPGVGEFITPYLEKGIRGVGGIVAGGGPNKGGALVDLAK